ncbi:hypothetical protein YC2023_050142 [Brassica napus]
MFRIAIGALLRPNYGLLFSRRVIGAVVAQLFWLCMKAVLSFIANDIVAKGQRAFVEIDRPSKPELACFKMAHEWRRSLRVSTQNRCRAVSRLFPARIYPREVKRRSQRSTMIVNRICQSSDVSADFTGRVSALISIFGEISLESLVEFYQRLFCYDLGVRNFFDAFP